MRERQTNAIFRTGKYSSCANRLFQVSCVFLLSLSAITAQAQYRDDPAIGRLEDLKTTLTARGKTVFTAAQTDALKTIAARISRTKMTKQQLQNLEALRDDGSFGPRACTAAEMANLTAAPTTTDYRVVLNCTPDFSVTPANIRKQVVIEGEETSFLTLDCNGGTITKPSYSGNDLDHPDALLIRSKPLANNRWSVPDMVQVKNCNISGGGVRVYGMGRNASDPDVIASSKTVNHVLNTRDAAPYSTRLDTVTITSPSAINVYAGNGVVDLYLMDSTLTNNGTNPVVYLEAETIGAHITGNTFTVANPGREYVAVDGSESNEITNNTFINPVKGGIFLYRNCGEDECIRHTTPSSNLISGNEFRYASGKTPQKNAIWLGSRGGKKTYCDADYNNGAYDTLLPYSSAPAKRNGDFAYYNTVQNNTFINWPSGSSSMKVSDQPPSGSLYNGTNGYAKNADYNQISQNN